jgi:hypothetical protein
LLRVVRGPQPAVVVADVDHLAGLLAGLRPDAVPDGRAPQDCRTGREPQLHRSLRLAVGPLGHLQLSHPPAV